MSPCSSIRQLSLSRFSVLIGLPDLAAIHVQSRQPTARMTERVDALEESQVQDFTALLRAYARE